MATTEAFSSELEQWLAADEDKTLGDAQDVFGERTFAVLILVLMAPTALPLPTGGVTYVLEVSTVLLAAEMVIGRRSVWLPSSWRRRKLGSIATDKAIPAILKVIRWCERWSRPRGAGLLARPWAWRVLGVLIGALTTAASLAPPFSGLDTLPAMGVVLLALAILLGDLVLAAVGLVVGVAGVLLILTIGAALFRAAADLW
jgi:hypothetical protein